MLLIVTFVKKYKGRDSSYLRRFTALFLSSVSNFFFQDFVSVFTFLFTVSCPRDDLHFCSLSLHVTMFALSAERARRSVLRRAADIMSTGVFVMTSGREEIESNLFSSGSGAELTWLLPATVMLIAGVGADGGQNCGKTMCFASALGSCCSALTDASAPAALPIWAFCRFMEFRMLANSFS